MSIYPPLYCSFAFWYIPSDVILTLYVMSPGGSLSTVIIDADDESDIRDNVREISVSRIIILLLLL